MEEKEKIKQLLISVIDLRGAIINDVIFLERVIDDFIANYFCTDTIKRDELMELVLTNERYALGSKIEVMVRILKKHYPEFYKEYPNIKGELDFISEKRNVLAHVLLDTTNEGIENEIMGFIRFKNAKERIPFTKEIILDLNDKIVKYKYAIQKLVHPSLT